MNFKQIYYDSIDTVRQYINNNTMYDEILK